MDISQLVHLFELFRRVLTKPLLNHRKIAIAHSHNLELFFFSFRRWNSLRKKAGRCYWKLIWFSWYTKWTTHLIHRSFYYSNIQIQPDAIRDGCFTIDFIIQFFERSSSNESHHFSNTFRYIVKCLQNSIGLIGQINIEYAKQQISVYLYNTFLLRAH